tara:strand:- start:7677 stop:8735 length:1059 start_codon:yes stop_codon:yes gene_type:complete
MSSIDEKFQKVIAESKAPAEKIEEDAAVGDAAIKKGAVPQQKSDLKNDAIEVGGSTKEKPEGPENVGAKAAAPVGATKDSTIQTKPSGASPSLPGGLSAKIFDDVEKEGDTISETEVKEDISAILAGADLDEEFQKKATTVFEAAVHAKVQEQVAGLKETAETRIGEELEKIKEEFAGRVENFLQYATEEWMSENELAIEKGLRSEVTEAFMDGLKKLFIESNINLPDEKLDAVADMSEKLDEMETRLNEQVEKNVGLHEKVSTYRKNEILTELSRGLAEVQKDKFTSLAEAVEFKSEETYREKLGQIKESYFGAKTPEVAEEISTEEPQAKVEKQLSESMTSYVAELAKRL